MPWCLMSNAEFAIRQASASNPKPRLSRGKREIMKTKMSRKRLRGFDQSNLRILSMIPDFNYQFLLPVFYGVPGNYLAVGNAPIVVGQSAMG